MRCAAGKKVVVEEMIVVDGMTAEEAVLAPGTVAVTVDVLAPGTVAGTVAVLAPGTVAGTVAVLAPGTVAVTVTVAGTVAGNVPLAGGRPNVEGRRTVGRGRQIVARGRRTVVSAHAQPRVNLLRKNRAVSDAPVLDLAPARPHRRLHPRTLHNPRSQRKTGQQIGRIEKLPTSMIEDTGQQIGRTDCRDHHFSSISLAYVVDT
eukprot:TRINITY_DN443_c0_g1_i15.p2 TRINITY_DN443_c0_g1~~TRINITY_DN443_c0_g1_i15.p2  ORF type:complete len:204 (-),score=14.70 TRINITY_DN443_c0_g1_i15:181-792(-)